MWESTSTITFTARPGASTFVDCAADVRRATLNGRELDPAQRRRGPDPAARPRGRERAGRRGRPDRHRQRGRHPAHGRRLRRAGLRLDVVRGRRRPPGLGLLRPARPEGAARVHRAGPGGVDGHQQRRAPLGGGRQEPGRRDGGRAALDASRTPRRSRRTSWWSTRARSTSCGARPAGTAWGSTAASRCAATSSATPTTCSRPPRPGWRSSASASAAVPAGALRPGVRAEHGRRDGELGLRHLDRRGAVPLAAHPRPARDGRRRCCCTRWRTCGSATW